MCKKQEVTRVLLTAAITMALVIVPLWPAKAGATGQAAGLRILRPTLTVNGCQFTMEATPPGDDGTAKPAVTLKAVNPGTALAEASVWVVVTASKPASAMSRVMPVGRLVASYERHVVLTPGGAETLTVAIDADLPADESITLALADRELMPATPAQAPPAGSRTK